MHRRPPSQVKSATVTLGVSINNGGTFPLGEISRITLDDISSSAPVLKENFYSWSCLAATSDAEEYKQCGYAYLIGDWSVDYQRLRFTNATDYQWLPNSQARDSLREV